MRVGALTTKNSGELIWYMEWHNVSLCDVIFNASRINRIPLFCSAVPVRSPFSNGCSLTNIEMHNSLYKGDPYNNAGQMAPLKSAISTAESNL